MEVTHDNFNCTRYESSDSLNRAEESFRETLNLGSSQSTISIQAAMISMVRLHDMRTGQPPSLDSVLSEHSIEKLYANQTVGKKLNRTAAIIAWNAGEWSFSKLTDSTT